jgi:hypothetical protein
MGLIACRRSAQKIARALSQSSREIGVSLKPRQELMDPRVALAVAGGMVDKDERRRAP